MTRTAGTAIRIGALVLAAALGSSLGVAQTSDNEAPVAAPPVASTPAAGSFPWPNQFSEGGQAFTVYPPQLERWQGDRLEGQAAVSVQPAGADKPFFGVVWLSARTEVDSATGVVKVRDISASRASFPTATQQSGNYLDAIRRHLVTVTWTVARDRLESDLAIDHTSRDVQSQPLRNTPPRILYSEAPAILVPIDGAPQFKEMAGLDVLRVVNTRALILQDKTTRRLYLFVANHWMEASAIEGPWAEANVRPSSLDEAKEQAVANGQVELVDEGESAANRVPVVYVTTGPAELVQTDGPPQYLPIQGTNLLYVTNTPNRLFLDLRTQKFYLLLSGRWYRAASLNGGSWEYVAGTSLPSDFAMIPPEHPTEGVRASVPGTPQAQEAVIANGVPQVAAVKRSAASLEITYDGPPQFQPIEGTQLQYAVNSPLPVIQVDSSSFYALDNGVWFVSNSPYGSWTVASWVPPVIYAIPRSSPLHYVTYVRVYDATPEVVYEGYTPGYVGSYVAPDATVVYGTGWYYQPWIGTVWYGPPVTWGFGFSFVNTWWSPWPYQPWFWAGWAPVPFYRPWWGPWCAPVFVAHGPVVVAHGPVVVGHGAVPINRVNVARVHAGNAGVTHIFNRWGGRVATPIGAPARAAWSGNGSRQAGAGFHQGQGGAAGTTRFGQGPTAAGAGRPAVAGTPGGAQNVQGFRRMDGQWQRFQGNGQWQNINAPNAPQPNRMNQSPGVAQGIGPRPGSVGGTPVASNAPTRGQWGPNQGVSPPRGPSGPVQATPLPGARTAMGQPGNAWGGSGGPRMSAPNAIGRPGGGGQMHSFTPHGARFAPSGGDAPPIGRNGGAWIPNHGGGAAVSGNNNNMGGRQSMGGRGQAWGGGGGGHMGGAHMR